MVAKAPGVEPHTPFSRHQKVVLFGYFVNDKNQVVLHGIQKTHPVIKKAKGATALSPLMVKLTQDNDEQKNRERLANLFGGTQTNIHTVYAVINHKDELADWFIDSSHNPIKS